MAAFGDTNQDKKIELRALITKAEEALPPPTIKELLNRAQSSWIRIIYPRHPVLRKALHGTAIVSVLIFFISMHQPLTDKIESLFSRKPSLVVGSMDFAEEKIIGEAIAQMLESRGVLVSRLFGETGYVLRSGIENGSIDCYMEYTGAPYNLVFHQPSIPDASKVYDYIKINYRKRGIEVGDRFGFQDEWAILVRREDADKFHLTNISDLRPLADKLVAGFTPDFLSDPVAGAEGLKKVYQLNFKDVSPLDLILLCQTGLKGLAFGCLGGVKLRQGGI